MVTRKELFGSQRFGSMLDHRLSRFHRETFAPIGWPKMESELANLFLRLIGAEAAATDKIAVGEQKYRPVLNAVCPHGSDFLDQAFVNLLFGKRSADEMGYIDVSPERQCQWKIIDRPQPKPQACRL